MIDRMFALNEAKIVSVPVPCNWNILQL